MKQDLYMVIDKRNYLLPLKKLDLFHLEFIDYLYDKNGDPIGIEVFCDKGTDSVKEKVDLYPNKEFSYTYWFIDTSNGSTEWYEDSSVYKVKLIPIDQAKELIAAGKVRCFGA